MAATKWSNSGIAVSVIPEGGTDPSAFAITTTGYYVFTMDLASNIFTLVPFTDMANMFYPTIGIIGNSPPEGWDSNGEIKFRANNAWTDNWGAKTPISKKTVLGSADSIPIVAGTYKMWFNALDGSYIFIGG